MQPLSWPEPRKYQQSQDPESQKGLATKHVTNVAVTFAILVALRWLVGINPRQGSQPLDWALFLPLAIVIAFLMAFGFPYFTQRLAQPIVVISDKGINQNVMAGRVMQHNFWPWDQISNCRIGAETRQCEAFRVLQILGPSGEAIVSLALTPKVPEERVVAALEARGKQVLR